MPLVDCSARHQPSYALESVVLPFPDSEATATSLVMIRKTTAPPQNTSIVNSDAAQASEVATFVAKMRAMSRQGTVAQASGRLLFAIDATMSRQPTWDLALGVQAEMFKSVADIGSLQVQLVYFRGAGECKSSGWVSNPENLGRLMTSVRCAGGFTQIGKVLGHARKEAEQSRVNAVVYVGDCMEEEVDDLCGRAGELALLGVPVFIFQEGHDPKAEVVFRDIARLTHGAFCRFNRNSADELKDLLSAVAAYATGGKRALEQLALARQGSAIRLIGAMKQT